MHNPGATAPLLLTLAELGYIIRLAADPTGEVRVFVGRGI